MAVDSLLTARALRLPEHGFGSCGGFAFDGDRSPVVQKISDCSSVIPAQPKATKKSVTRFADVPLPGRSVESDERSKLITRVFGTNKTEKGCISFPEENRTVTVDHAPPKVSVVFQSTKDFARGGLSRGKSEGSEVSHGLFATKRQARHRIVAESPPAFSVSGDLDLIPTTQKLVELIEDVSVGCKQSYGHASSVRHVAISHQQSNKVSGTLIVEGIRETGGICNPTLVPASRNTDAPRPEVLSQGCERHAELRGQALDSFPSTESLDGIDHLFAGHSGGRVVDGNAADTTGSKPVLLLALKTTSFTNDLAGPGLVGARKTKPSSFALGDVSQFDLAAGLCHRKPLTGDGLVYTRTASQQGVDPDGC